MSTEIESVMYAVYKEQLYQARKWGANKEQSFPGYLLIMRKALEKAENAWLTNKTGERQTALEEVIQVTATAIKCLEVYGLTGCPASTNDH